MNLEDNFHFVDLPTFQLELQDCQRNAFIIKEIELSDKDEATTDQVKGHLKKPKKQGKHKNIDFNTIGKADHIPKISRKKKIEKLDKSISTKSKIPCNFEGCQHEARNLSELSEHSLRNHIKDISFFCAECKYATNCKGNLRRHQRKEHDPSFQRRGKIQNTKKKFPCEFSDCDYQATSYDLKMHNSRIHIKEKTFNCTLCKFTTHHETYLKKHRRGNHEQNTSYPCTFDSCEYKSNWQQSVKAHFRRVHLGEAKTLFPCQKCDYKGGSEKAVSYHYDARHTDKKQSCPHEECSYESKWVSSINIHLRVNHGEGKALAVLQCESCGFKTHKSNYMKKHTRDVHINEPKESLYCDQCSFNTFYQKQLKRHVNEHMGIFTKHCETCDFKCHSITKLRRHKIAKHNFKSVFMCDQCNYCAPQSSDLKKHLRNKHLEK